MRRLENTSAHCGMPLIPAIDKLACPPCPSPLADGALERLVFSLQHVPRRWARKALAIVGGNVLCHGQVKLQHAKIKTVFIIEFGP